MRISLVTETYPPEVNGVAMTLERVVQGLIGRGHDVQVVRPRQHKQDDSEPEATPRSLVLPGIALPKYDGLHMGLPARGKLLRSWRSGRPDVVHIATEGPLGLTALWAARKLDIPVTSTFHTNFHQYGKHYGYGFLNRLVIGYLRYVHNRCACTMVPSADVADGLRDDGFKNLDLLARGVDREQFNPSRRDPALREQWGAGPEDLVACYVGRVAGEKNIPLAVRAFEAMREKLPNARFVIVGDGPAKAGLEKQHPDYHFAGMRRGEDLARHYASADVFLFPSVTETFGNVVSEAMSSRLAVAMYDYAAGKALIRDGENGRAVAFDDDDAFIAAAVSLARPLPELEAMRQAALDSTADMGWDAVVEHFEGVLRDVSQHGEATDSLNLAPVEAVQ